MEGAGAIERQLRLIRLLANRRGGMSVEDLVGEAEVSAKTIRRDLERLASAGFPLTAEVVDHGRKRWRLDADGYTGTGLAFDEAFAMLLAAGSLRSLAGTGLGDALDGAVNKIRSGLSERVIRYCDRLTESVRLLRRATVDYGDKADILEQLLLGHEDRRNVFITYHSRRSTEPTTYPISPYAIRLYRDAVYVIAQSEQHDEVRLFKLDRISDAEVTPVPFQLSKDFDADEYLASALGVFAGDETHRVRIRFAARAARPLSETTWHPSQQLQPQPDGSVIASYEVALTPELVGWILSIGRDATVLEPPELIERIRDEIAAVGDRYAHKTGKSSGRRSIVTDRNSIRLQELWAFPKADNGAAQGHPKCPLHRLRGGEE